MPHLSAVIIACNEAAIIGQALASLQGVVDEIVVVDSGSEDETPDICQRHGARVVHRHWEGYAAAKNYGNGLATHPWILSIDADEVLSEELRAGLMQAKLRLWKVDTVFSFNRLTNYCGHWVRHSGWYPDTKIRVWNRDHGHWEGEIHEQVVFYHRPMIVHLKGDLWHYSFPERADYLRQRENFTTLAAQALFKQGKRAGLVKVYLSPIIRFLRDYLINKGFLDGHTGWEVCLGTAKGVYLKYHKLRSLHLTGRR
jgi:glycosyltransferase involved in cell wall biosynthesis